MTRHERFTCTIERGDVGQITGITIALVPDETEATPSVSLNGRRAERVASSLHDILRAGGITGRQWSSSAPIELDQTTAAHAWLLLDAVRPLRRGDRIDEVSDGVARMSREEASYWYAKSRQPRGLRAARLLLSDDARRR